MPGRAPWFLGILPAATPADFASEADGIAVRAADQQTHWRLTRIVDPEREVVKETALDDLRAALVRGTGIGAAVRACFYRHPLFASTLMSESMCVIFDVNDLC